MRGARLTVALLGLSGCLGPQQAPPPLFYPPPPQAPRAVFLGGINDVPVDRVEARGSAAEHESGASDRPSTSFWDLLTGAAAFPSVPLIKPAGLAVHGDVLFICDPRASRVYRLDYRTRRIHEWTGSDATPLVSPVAVAIAPDGTAFVADAAARYVLPFAPDGRPRAPIYVDDATFRPVAVACAPDGLYVADARGRKIWRFPSGQAPASRSGSNSAAALFNPSRRGSPAAELPFVTALALSPQGVMLAAGGVDGRIRAVGSSESGLWNDMGTARDSTARRPKGMAFDPGGRLFLVDAALQCVVVREPGAGGGFDFGGSRQGRDALVLPHGIALCPAMLRYYRSSIPPGFSADQIAFVSNRGGGSGVSVFAVGRSNSSRQAE